MNAFEFLLSLFVMSLILGIFISFVVLMGQYRSHELSARAQKQRIAAAPDGLPRRR